MNIFFLIGKIITNIEYKFILNSKNVSISIFYIQLNNKSIIKIKAYNEIADICYNSILKGNIISTQKNK